MVTTEQKIQRLQEQLQKLVARVEKEKKAETITTLEDAEKFLDTRWLVNPSKGVTRYHRRGKFVSKLALPSKARAIQQKAWRDLIVLSEAMNKNKKEGAFLHTITNKMNVQLVSKEDSMKDIFPCFVRVEDARFVLQNYLKLIMDFYMIK